MTAPNSGTVLTQNTSYAVSYVQTALGVITNTSEQFAIPTDRYWLSIPRRMDNPVWEVILINFRKQVPISRISFELFEVAQNWEIWYYPGTPPATQITGTYFPDPAKRLPVLDASLRKLSGALSTGATNQFYAYDYNISPIVARTIELRVKRRVDTTLGPSTVFSIGVRNFLCKREIYDAQDAMRPIEDSVDPMGNLVQSFVRQYEPTQAIDGNSFTYWKCSPQPSPNAVVDFYIDVRDSAGLAQRIDRIFLDPTHAGQNLNMYFSVDDTVGPRTLALNRFTPSADVDVPWVEGVGLDVSAPTALYTIDTSSFNIDMSESLWIAGTWIPGFDSLTAPAYNLYILNSDTFSFSYNPTNSQFILVSGNTVGFFPCAGFRQDVNINFSIRMINDATSLSDPVVYPGSLVFPSSTTFPTVPPVAGIYFDAMLDDGTVLASNIIPVPYTITSFPTYISFEYSQGYIASFFMKQEPISNNQMYSALANISEYLLPEVPLVDAQGQYLENSLSNMVYGADFKINELGFGGLDHLYFTEKVWTPIWKDWTLSRGIYYFPYPVYCKFLKLEFSNLTQEPYTIHESGITVKYQTFPLTVLQTCQNVIPSTIPLINTSSVQTTTTATGVLFDNYYTTYNSAVAVVPNPPVYLVNIGPTTIDTVPNLLNTPLNSTLTGEQYSTVGAAINATPSVEILAASAYSTVISGDSLANLGITYSIPWASINAINTAPSTTAPSTTSLPQRSSGWWIFPGQQLRIPSSIMQQLTGTSTTIEKPISNSSITTRRNRFVNTCIHRYDYQTAERDAAIAYFAGLREIEVYRIDYTVAEDTEIYNFPLYDIDSFAMTNMIQYSYSGDWKSNVTDFYAPLLYPSPTLFPGSTIFPVVVPIVFPETDLYPSPFLYPQTPNSYLPAAADWSDHSHHWGAVDSSWGYLPVPPNGRIASKTFNSLSLVTAVSISVTDRGLYQPISGVQLAPAGLADSPVGYWSSFNEDWRDSNVVWGTRESLVAEVYRPTQYSGKNAIYIYRAAGDGIAGLTTSNFSILPHTRIRVSLDYYLPQDTGNDLVLEIVDVTNAPGESIIFSQTIKNKVVGTWANYHTTFHVVSDYGIESAECRFFMSGTNEEAIYVTDLYPSLTTILYELSNDNGTNYVEATEAIFGGATTNDVVFQNPDNLLTFRVTLYDIENDFVQGVVLEPHYI